MVGEETLAADVETAIETAVDNGDFGAFLVTGVQTTIQTGGCICLTK